MSPDDNSPNPPVVPDEKKKVLLVYGLFCAALIAGLIPHIVFFLIALLLFIAVVPAADHVRYKAPSESLAESHMTYIIRTVWIVSIAAIAALVPATAYIIAVYDTDPLQPCVLDLVTALDAGRGFGPEVIRPCMGPFMAANQKLFMAVGLIIGAPATIYLIGRLARGINRARRGEPLRNPRRWL